MNEMIDKMEQEAAQRLAEKKAVHDEAVQLFVSEIEPDDQPDDQKRQSSKWSNSARQRRRSLIDLAANGGDLQGDVTKRLNRDHVTFAGPVGVNDLRGGGGGKGDRLPSGHGTGVGVEVETVGGRGTKPDDDDGDRLPSGHGTQSPPGAEGAAEDKRSKYLMEIEILETALDFYKDRIAGFNEEFLDETRDEFFTKIATALQNGDVLDAGMPRLMPPRVKKARITAESKSDLMASLAGQMRMHCGAVAASTDPSTQAAMVFLNNQVQNAIDDPVGLMTESLNRCSDVDIEKILTVCGQTNNNTKWEIMSRAFLKQVYDMVQQKDLQHANLKLACTTLVQLIVTSGWAGDNGLVSWTGEGGTVQAMVSHVLKNKCMERGAAAATAAADAARAANGEM
jgi:hypothetical protein